MRSNLHGKILHYPLFSRTVEAWAAAGGGTLSETLEKLPFRVPGSNVRNYLVGLVINYQGTMTDSSGAPAALTARQIHHSLGVIQFKDAWGQMLPAMWVDRLVTSNFSEGIQSPDKHGTTHGLTPTDATPFNVNCSVILAYAPKAFADKVHSAVKWNGVFPCSLLGQEAELQFAVVGDLIGECAWDAAPLVTVTAVVWQSKELIVPAPTQIIDTLLDRTFPVYIEEGEPRKIEDMVLLYRQDLTTTPNGYWTSAGVLDMNFDGAEVLNGRAWSLADSIALSRNHEHCFRGVNDPGNAAAVAGILYDANFYQGMATTILDADGFEQATQGRAVRRLEIGGFAAIETRSDTILIQRRRYECPGRLFEQWAEREGIPVEKRKDLRLGNGAASNSGLSREESIGAQMKVASRKERRA